MKEDSGSFLQKRTKKLLDFAARVSGGGTRLGTMSNESNQLDVQSARVAQSEAEPPADLAGTGTWLAGETLDLDEEAAARALWLIRLFFGREPEGAHEIAEMVSTYGRLSNARFVQYALQSEKFVASRSDIANMFVDINFRLRIASLANGAQARKSPNFFVVGQPRCGTTSLWEYFLEHPSVFVPAVKEINYYSHWSKDRSGEQGLSYDDYLMYFMIARDEKVVCDISPFYLSEPGCALRLYRDRPDARILCILRNPLDLVISRFNLDHIGASAEDFDAWILQGIAGSRASLPRWEHTSAISTLFHCRIAQQLAEYKRYFANALKICLFDDMVADQRAAYEDICAFIGVPFVYQRSYWAWKAPGHAVPSHAVRRQLAQWLLPDLREVEQLTGLNLSRWYDGWEL
jgi:hypothetical protein